MHVTKTGGGASLTTGYSLEPRRGIQCTSYFSSPKIARTMSPA